MATFPMICVFAFAFFKIFLVTDYHRANDSDRIGTKIYILIVLPASSVRFSEICSDKTIAYLLVFHQSAPNVVLSIFYFMIRIQENLMLILSHGVEFTFLG